MRKRWIATCLLAASATQAAGPGMLSHGQILQRVVGNTIHFEAGDEHVFEYLDPAGEIRAESTAHGKFVARWRFLDERTLCFESADPMSSGCVGIELQGRQARFIRRDGVIEGPFELLPGNPRRL